MSARARRGQLSSCRRGSLEICFTPRPTFDDVLLQPFRSRRHPKRGGHHFRAVQADQVRIPLVSSPMDTVTRGADGDRHGPPGRHRRAAPQPGDRRPGLRRSTSSSGSEIGHGLRPGHRSARTPRSPRLDGLCGKYRVSGLPGRRRRPTRLLGIITNRDLRFCRRRSVRPTGARGDDADAADHRAGRHLAATSDRDACASTRCEKLAARRRGRPAAGLITVKDFVKTEQYPERHQGRRRPAAGRRRDRLLRRRVGAGHDARSTPASTCWSPDTAHGHVAAALDMVASAQDRPGRPGTSQVDRRQRRDPSRRPGARRGGRRTRCKVGVGPGSICTTRVVAGVGVPQVTAIHERRSAGDAGRRAGHRRRRAAVLR